MISADVVFEGFGAQTWLRLLTLLGYQHPVQSRHAPVLVVVEDADGAAIAAFRTDTGIVAASDYRGRAHVGEMCRSEGCARAVIVQEGALETLAERAAAAFPLDGHYLAQWLRIFGALQQARSEGTIAYWPARRTLPVPTPAMVERALDLVLPDNSAAVAVTWERGQLHTAVAIRRRGGLIDAVVGPRSIEAWTGPLSGDYRRDHRMITRAVHRRLAPVHVGLFATHQELTQLLRASDPGAWFKATALREVILDPAPPYAGVALGADGARAVASTTRKFLGGLDVFASVEPLLSQARERLAETSSITSLLGFNPLERLAERLKQADQDP